MIKKFVFLIFLLVPIFFMRSAGAFEEINTGYFSNQAAGGYDVVSYFTAGIPTVGLKAYKSTWKSADWLFSNAENLALFTANPEDYAPQYGGYCSNQMSLGNLSDVDPNVWMMVEGKLYFFGHIEGKDRWQHQTLNRILDADKNWRKFFEQN